MTFWGRLVFLFCETWILNDVMFVLRHCLPCCQDVGKQLFSLDLLAPKMGGQSMISRILKWNKWHTPLKILKGGYTWWNLKTNLPIKVLADGMLQKFMQSMSKIPERHHTMYCDHSSWSPQISLSHRLCLLYICRNHNHLILSLYTICSGIYLIWEILVIYYSELVWMILLPFIIALKWLNFVVSYSSLIENFVNFLSMALQWKLSLWEWQILWVDYLWLFIMWVTFHIDIICFIMLCRLCYIYMARGHYICNFEALDTFEALLCEVKGPLPSSHFSPTEMLWKKGKSGFSKTNVYIRISLLFSFFFGFTRDSNSHTHTHYARSLTGWAIAGMPHRLMQTSWICLLGCLIYYFTCFMKSQSFSNGNWW